MGLCASSDALTASQLESRLRAAKATRALNLRGCGLREIPAEALDLGSTLKTLDISSNKDIDLSGLSSFTRLKKLIVSGCGLTALPECASFAATLEHLDASGNSITSLSGIRLPAVKVLVLAGNELMGSLSELGGCANLTVRFHRAKP
jgi:Leucine-rich repeat (LRR) protein